MSLTFSTYQTSISNLMPKPVTDPDWAQMLANMIDDAEQRLYRELQLLNTITQDSSAAFAVNTRSFTLPSSNGTFVVTNDIYAITPAGTSNPDLGTRNPLSPCSREMLDFMFPSSAGSGVPQYFAMSTQNRILVGPWPDQAYQCEVSGTVRPAALSSSNVTSLLSVYFPDCFIAASMVFGSGYMKNYGAGVDDPQQGVNWESHLQRLMQSAETEEAMKKFTSAGWSPKAPAQLATPART
jgi:hypothetical protein